MKVFVSYSFRPESKWVTDYVIPLIANFGHEPVTGELLNTGPLDDEVKKKIRQYRRVRGTFSSEPTYFSPTGRRRSSSTNSNGIIRTVS